MLSGSNIERTESLLSIINISTRRSMYPGFHITSVVLWPYLYIYIYIYIYIYYIYIYIYIIFIFLSLCHRCDCKVIVIVFQCFFGMYIFYKSYCSLEHVDL